jgi:hypothetical protein
MGLTEFANHCFRQFGVSLWPGDHSVTRPLTYTGKHKEVADIGMPKTLTGIQTRNPNVPALQEIHTVDSAATAIYKCRRELKFLNYPRKALLQR